MKEPKDLTTQADAARLAGIKLSVLNERVRRNRIPSYEKFGKRLVSIREVIGFEVDRPGPKPKGDI